MESRRAARDRRRGDRLWRAARGAGEFTLRAFLNGRIDLMQAEAVADLIDAATPLQARAAFDQLEGTLTCTIREIDATLFDVIARLEASVDFPEEGYHFVEPDAIAREIDVVLAKTRALLDEGRRGRLIREGVQVAIVGRPNVGKSSLFNALVGASRAIVTDVPGTTRDLVTEAIDLDGVRVTLVDTCGSA
jgi:tRNA modification GTPase